MSLNPFKKDPETLQSPWDHLRFSLFGELKIVYWFFAGYALLVAAFWSAIAYVIFHFIQKAW